MKTVEEKAKAYDKALERARKLKEDPQGVFYEYSPKEGDTICDYIFPELKESDDERIRKEIYQFVYEQRPEKEWIAWLEKQGKNNFVTTEEDEKIREQIVYAINQLHVCECTKNKLRTWVENQGEQKPTLRERYKNIAESEWFKKTHDGMSVSDDEKVDNVNKIEQKFKVGDWITNGACIIQITSVDDTYYWCDNDCVGGDIESMDKEYHLWTIEDARPGDVLAEEPIDCYPFPFVAIYKKQNKEDFDSYCFIGFNGKFYEGEMGHSTENIHPATKEQCDIFFAEMKEAGYEWDAEKKELKKVIVPIFHIGDTIVEKDLDECGYGTIKDIKDGQYIFTDGSGMNINEQEGWQLVKTSTNIEQKPIWSDYDECMLTNLLDDQHCSIDSEYVHWLKSIKDKYAWKPSKEQLTQLKIAVSKGTAGYFNNDLLRELYKQLKNL